jgi:iron(III) transport system substrate-binding protein
LKKSTTYQLFAGLIAGSVLLTGCGGGTSPESSAEVDISNGLVIEGEPIADPASFDAAKKEGSVVFYTGGSEQSEAQVTEAFTADTGIKVETIRLAPNRLSERILSEQGAGKLGADVIRISGEDLTKSVAESGAFSPYNIPADFKLAEDAKYENGLYYRTFDRVYTFAYNNQLVHEGDAPKNWSDLLDPKWKGKLGIVQVGAGGSTSALTRFQLDVLGEDYLKGYAAQEPRIFDSVAAQTDALARGEISVATVPIATGYGSQLQGAPITIAVPEEGMAGYAFYAGRAATAPHPAAAEVFAKWLLAKRALEVSAAQGDYPARTDVKNPSAGDLQLPAADTGVIYRSTMDESIKNLSPDAELWKKIFGYTG